MIEILQQYGFTQKEAKIYLAWLELGSAPASSIARQANEIRSTVYSILKEFKKQGIVQEIKRKEVSYFSVISPEMLLRKLEDKYTTFKEKLPELMVLAEKFGNKPKVQFFEGVEWLKMIYEELLTSEVDILSFLGLEFTNKALLEYLYNDFLPRRLQKKIYAKVILSDTWKNKQYAWIDKKAKKESIVINSPVFAVEWEISLYGPNKINIVLFNDNDMSGLCIQSEQLYTTLKWIFDLIWQQNNAK